jgi:hypothetical protein
MQPTHNTLAAGIFAENSRGIYKHLWFVEPHIAPK